MPADPLASYLAEIQAEYAKGVATEHSYRPALKTLLENIQPDKNREVTNEPKQIDCGAPDYLIARRVPYGPARALGHIEAKTIGVRLDEIERDSNRVEPTSREGRQFKRYREALPNLILTDYVDFRYYIDGKPHSSAHIATSGAGGKVTIDDAGMSAVRDMLTYFLTRQPEPITRADDLALRMAYLTRLIRERIVLDFEQDVASPLLRRWRDTLARVLIADLNQPQNTGEFADMFAQTLAYGLFSARTMDKTPESFSRQEAQKLIPATNPFLRDFFYEITGPRLEDEGFARFVDDLTALLANTDMDAVLSTFGKRTRQEDPVIHFYETFLAAYDPKLREARGVYYTPEPVVQYIVRSVDHILKTRFSLRDGLADRSMTQIPNRDPNLRVQGSKEMRKTRDVHRVLVLDPACGTGTFLYAMVDLIRQRFMDRGDAGDWSDYVRLHLLPRIFGFELLMAPYAVAHFKLGLQLAGRDLPEEERAQWAYNFSSNERLHVYLTNTLEEAHEYGNLPLFVEGVARESLEANEVKRELPIMVVMGNPPYSGHSANAGEWIAGLLRGRDTQTNEPTGNYFEVNGAPLGEKNPQWLNDDYVKFIRFAQWRIETTGAGVLAFISNNGYLDNPTFRGMRQALMQTFDSIYLLDLHGNSKKKETAPDGSKDENVFDIQQGVAIGIFVKEANKVGLAKVYHAHAYGTRARKYEFLLAHDSAVTSTEWVELSPQTPFYLFVPQDTSYLAEYDQGWKITEAMPVNNTGIITSRDRFVIDFDQNTIAERISKLRSTSTRQETVSHYGLHDTREMSFAKSLEIIENMDDPNQFITPLMYRPFDVRWVFYHRALIRWPVIQFMRHFRAGPNVGLITSRLTKGEKFAHAQVTRNIAEVICMSPNTSNNGFVFPLYLYPESSRQATFAMEEPSNAPGGRSPNLAPAFIEEFRVKLGLNFITDGKGDLANTFGPEDVFNYVYAVLHSPTYRQRYAEFLKMDFPRVPLTSDLALFKTLAAQGERLVALHLMEVDGDNPTPSFPIRGDNRVEVVHYTLPTESGDRGRVYINKAQYFEGVPPDVWEFHIGGYQVAKKWLKDRKGRELTYDDREHYKGIIAALGETGRLMQEVDEAIPGWPIS